MLGVDGRAIVTSNWSDFVKAAEIEEHQLCAFAFMAKSTGLSLSV